MADNFYIAYGSNLSSEQMEVRTPDAVIIGTGILENWRLLFRRYATIEKNKGYSVPVLIWKISEQDEKNLDRYEGYPKFYTKQTLKIDVITLNGEYFGKVSAMVYIMTPDAIKRRMEEAAPSLHYYNILANGYKEFGFDKKILHEALVECM